MRGFRQIPGVDYVEHELFSPVVRIPTLRYLFALSAELDLELQHLDICTAFLDGDLSETIYVRQPEGFEGKQHPHKTCKLRKSLYGLKQAPRMWHQKIDGFLKSCGFKHSASDPNLYVLYDASTMVILALYVDDLVLASNHRGGLQSVKTMLQSKFEMKDLGNLSCCLSVQIICNRGIGTITLHQSKYVQEVLKRFNLLSAKPVPTPLDVGVKLSSSDQPATDKDKQEMS